MVHERRLRGPQSSATKRVCGSGERTFTGRACGAASSAVPRPVRQQRIQAVVVEHGRALEELADGRRRGAAAARRRRVVALVVRHWVTFGTVGTMVFGQITFAGASRTAPRQATCSAPLCTRHGVSRMAARSAAQRDAPGQVFMRCCSHAEQGSCGWYEEGAIYAVPLRANCVAVVARTQEAKSSP